MEQEQRKECMVGELKEDPQLKIIQQLLVIVEKVEHKHTQDIQHHIQYLVKQLQD